MVSQLAHDGTLSPQGETNGVRVRKRHAPIIFTVFGHIPRYAG